MGMVPLPKPKHAAIAKRGVIPWVTVGLDPCVDIVEREVTSMRIVICGKTGACVVRRWGIWCQIVQINQVNLQNLEWIVRFVTETIGAKIAHSGRKTNRL